MAERGLIFSAPMVRALLAGTKSQTRRILKPQPERPAMCGGTWLDLAVEEFRGGMDGETPIVRFDIGDRLWVRETWTAIFDESEVSHVKYRATCPEGIVGRWRSPIHMPRWASRLTLTVTDVRVERLQDISEADARAEGVEPPETERDQHDWSICPICGGTGLHGSLGQNLGYREVDCRECDTPRKRYQHLWNGLHGPDAWASNPWVAALTFSVDRAPGSVTTAGAVR